MRNSRFVRSIRAVAMACCAVLLCAAIGSASMQAQDTTQQGPPPGGRGNPAERQQRQLDMMTKALSLTPDQVTQVKAILDDQQKQMMAARNSDSGADPREAMMAIRKASNDKIKALLTDDQKPKFDEMMSQQRGRGGYGGGQGGPPPPPPTQY
jgi:Spy/CpxP family protein refolding chaperone